MHTTTLAIAIATLASRGLTACSTTTTPAGTEAPTASAAAPGVDLPDGWIWAAGENVPVVETEPKLPVTVTDATGTEVEIDDASRIIASGDDIAVILGGFGLADLGYAAPANSASAVALAAPSHFEFSQETGAERAARHGRHALHRQQHSTPR